MVLSSNLNGATLISTQIIIEIMSQMSRVTYNIRTKKIENLVWTLFIIQPYIKVLGCRSHASNVLIGNLNALPMRAGFITTFSVSEQLMENSRGACLYPQSSAWSRRNCYATTVSQRWLGIENVFLDHAAVSELFIPSVYCLYCIIGLSTQPHIERLTE